MFLALWVYQEVGVDQRVTWAMLRATISGTTIFRTIVLGGAIAFTGTVVLGQCETVGR